MLDARIIRNRLKIEGTIKNAKVFLTIKKSLAALIHTFGSLWTANKLKTALPVWVM